MTKSNRGSSEGDQAQLPILTGVAPPIPPSIFNDVIGPVMRGPSSSHCAAAVRIGRLARDLMGRLRRESWLVSKRRRYLDIALHVFIAYRNYVRRRFNRDEASPAQMLGFAPRRLTPGQVLSWRQEFGRRSIHPLASRAQPVGNWQEREQAA